MPTTATETKFKLTSAVKREIVKIIDERIKDAHVTKEDFSELKEIVRDIGLKVGDLAEAQKRTETKVGELAEAQKRTETKVGELAEVQKRTETKVGELAEVQKKTEYEVRSLAKAVKGVQKELGGISNTIGYSLEDKFYQILPEVIKIDFEIEVNGFIERRYLEYIDGRDDEINIFGEGIRNGKKVYIIGESKAQLGKQDVNKFVSKLNRVKKHLRKEIAAILLCYNIHPKVEKYLKDTYSEIRLYKSFELIRRARQ